MFESTSCILNISEIKTEDQARDEFILLSELEQLKSNNYQVISEPLDQASFVYPDVEIKSNENCFLMQDDKRRGGSFYIRFKEENGKQVKIWSCGICGKEFGHQYTLMRHLPTHTDERKFQCNTCGKAFRQMSTLSQHKAIHSADRPYICEICQKTFNRVSTLISHRKTHTGLKPHRCHLCNKAFHQKGNLRNHIFTHTNERPYKCEICEKGFNQMSNLMCHKVKAHQRTDKPKYDCRICGQDFRKKVGLRNHEHYQHGSGTSTQDRSKFSNAIIVNPIQTEAMKLALESNQTPFALLRPLTGIPVLVRILPAGNKQMLIPATADDLKKHGQISIAAKKETVEGSEDENKNGCTVQIKIPVVATVIQQSGKDGLSISVVSPGPNGKIIDQSVADTQMLNTFDYNAHFQEEKDEEDHIFDMDLPVID